MKSQFIGYKRPRKDSLKFILQFQPRLSCLAMAKIRTLQTMRLFASLGVVQYHLWHNYLGVAIGHPGTDFFLVLVGVVTALTQTKRISTYSWIAYIRDRYIRLYITYIPLFIMVLVIKWHEANWDWVWRSFLFLPLADRLPVIGAVWMLSQFMVFYFIFGLVFLVRTELVLLPVFFTWIAAITAYNWLDWKPGLPTHWSELLFEGRNLEFIFGYLAGVILRNDRGSIFWGRWVFWIGVIGIIGSGVLLNVGMSITARIFLVGLPVTFFILGLARLEQQQVPSRIVNFLTKPSLVWLGGTSYVLYLSHSVFLQAWSYLFPVTPG